MPPGSLWRSSRETVARNRCPLFDSAVGICPIKSMTIDSLHCLDLGVFNSFAKHVLWELILSGAWGRRQTVEETVSTAVTAIRKDLNAWYKSRLCPARPRGGRHLAPTVQASTTPWARRPAQNRVPRPSTHTTEQRPERSGGRRFRQEGEGGPIPSVLPAQGVLA